jgi:hypothetical protein
VTIENHRDDLERLRAGVPADAPPYIFNLIAFQESLLDTIEDMDDSILDILEHHEDILQPRTAAIFAVVIAGCQGIIPELAKRLDRKVKRDVEIAKVLNDLKARCDAAAEVLGQITAQQDSNEDEEEFDPNADVDGAPAPVANDEVADADAAQ